MAMPRKKIPMDSPGVISARERMRPIDFSVVVPKDEDDKKRWHYRWENIGRLQQSTARSRGYVIVQPDEVDTPNAYADTSAGSIVHGDMVLMKVPMHIYKQSRVDKEAYSQAIVRSSMEQSVEVAAQAGIKIKHRIAKGQTFTKKTEEGYNENDEETVLEVS